MHVVSTAITGTIQKGELVTESALSLFPDGTEVIIIERQGWNQIAGSDHARHRAQVAEQELTKARQEVTALRAEREAVKK